MVASVVTESIGFEEGYLSIFQGFDVDIIGDNVFVFVEGISI